MPDYGQLDYRGPPLFLSAVRPPQWPATTVVTDTSTLSRKGEYNSKLNVISQSPPIVAPAVVALSGFRRTGARHG